MLLDAPAGWIRRLAGACRRHPRLLAGALVASGLGIGIEALVPLITRLALDDAVAGRTDRLSVLVSAVLAVAAVRFGASFARRYLGGRLSLDVQHDLRRAVFRAVQWLDGARQDALRTGQIVSRANSDLQVVQSMLAMVPLVVGNVVLFVAGLAAMLWLSPLLTVVAVIVVPVGSVLTVRSRRVLFPATWSAHQRAAEIAEQVEENVTGVRIVKGFGQEDRAVAALEGAARRLFAERMRVAGLTARFGPALTSLPQLGQVAVFALGG